MVSWLLGLGIYVLLVLAVTNGSPGDSCPRNRGLPAGHVKGTNSFRNRALYKLDLRQAFRGFTPNAVYKFRVHSTAKKVKFNDATVVIEAQNSTCGAGTLLVYDNNLHSPKGCPDVVTTQQKQPMGRTHVRWQAPSCGCVHIRARVHANSVYYIEDEDVDDGPLAQTICFNETSTKQKTRSSLRNSKSKDKISREARFERLCEASRKYEMDIVLKSDAFLNRRLVRLENEFELDRLNIALEQRKSHTLQCCNLGGNQMMECFGDVRRRRIDSFCGTGEPEVPFSKSRYGWIKQRETECCWQIGESRYTCFNYTLYTEAMPQNDMATKLVSPLDEDDLDDFDPANDLEDFHVNQTSMEDKTVTKSKTGRTRTHSKGTFTDMEDESSSATGRVQSKYDTNDNDDDSDEEVDDLQADKLQSGANVLKNSKASEKEEDDSIESKKDDLEDDVKTGIDANRKFSDQDCCLNGITSGTNVIADGFEGCFTEAEKYNNAYSKWNKRCDRRFVMCCMRVVDGMNQTTRSFLR